MADHWHPWGRPGKRSAWPVIHHIAVASNPDGRLEVFAADTDGGLWQIWQTAPNNGWSH